MLGGIPLTVKAFAVALANSLITKGIDKETAVKNVLKITRSLSEDDLQEIAEYNGAEDFVPLTEALTKLIEDERRAAIISDAVAHPMAENDNAQATKQMNAVPRGASGADLMAETKQMNAVHTSDFRRPELNPMAETKEIDAVSINTGGFKKPDVRRMEETKKVNAVQMPPRAQQVTEDKTRTNIPAQDKSRTHYTEYKKTELTPRGAKFFWTIFALTLPLTLLAAVLYFGTFALCVVSVAALIVGCFIIMGCVVIAGSLIGLVGLIYGVIQMFTSVGIGIYEVGVAIVVSGLTVILSVLVYLLATRVLPYLLKQLIAFTKHTLGQLPGLVDRAREECNRL